MSEPSQLELNKLRRDIRSSGHSADMLGADDLLEVFHLLASPREDIDKMVKLVASEQVELDSLEAIAADVWYLNVECLTRAEMRFGLA